MNRRPPISPAALLALLLHLPGPLLAQPLPTGIEEEELEEPATPEPTAAEVLDIEALELLYAQAEALFLSPDRAASLPLFGQVVENVESFLATRIATAVTAEAGEGTAGVPSTDGIATGSEAPVAAGEEALVGEDVQVPSPERWAPEVRFLTPEARSLLTRSLARRAEIHLGLGERSLAEGGLERWLEVRPGGELEGEGLSPALLELFGQVRRRTVGEVVLVAEPPDLEAWLDGRPAIPADAPAGTVAGDRWLEATRPGYRPVARTISVAAGRRATEEVELERTSAVIRLHTRPPGAELFLDGAPVAATEGTASPDLLPPAAAGAYRPEEFSAELVVDGVELGLRRLEVRKEGYRSYRAELVIEELLDYPLPPIVLEPEAATLVFRSLPPGAEIRIDDELRRPEATGSAAPRLTLSPGEHRVVVTAGASRVFVRDLLVADRQTVELDVQPRPGIAFLGVVGGDRSTADQLAASLRRTLGDSGRWALLDRSAEGPELLAAAGLDDAALTAPPEPGAKPTDWGRVQALVDRELPGLIYLVGVLPDDLLATEAALLLWSAAPGPAHPDRLRLPLDEPGATARLGAYLHRGLRIERPWVGALVIDSGASPHPVIADVTPGSPAEAAGLRPGDELLGIAGVPVQTRAAFDQRILAAESGETVELAVRAADGTTRTLRLSLGSSPRLLPPQDPERLRSVTYADLQLLWEEARPRDRWALRLDQALILLRSREWESAVRHLRDLDAPQRSHGVSRATVDYYLGRALGEIGGRYRDTAVQSLERSAGVPGARRFHHDEAWIAPRARARLEALGAAVESRR